MAVAKCYECAHPVSTKAASCPHCGAPGKPILDTSIQGNVTSLAHIVVVIMVLGLLILFASL